MGVNEMFITNSKYLKTQNEYFKNVLTKYQGIEGSFLVELDSISMAKMQEVLEQKGYDNATDYLAICVENSFRDLINQKYSNEIQDEILKQNQEQYYEALPEKVKNAIETINSWNSSQE